MDKVLITGLIRDSAWIVPEYLEVIHKLDTAGLDVGYYFIVDHSTDGSEKLVYDTIIGKDAENPLWPNSTVAFIEEPECEPDPVPKTHRKRLDKGIYEHIKSLRERLRKMFLELDYDYMLCIDHDVLVNPDTLKRLLEHREDFVCATVPCSPKKEVVVGDAIISVDIIGKPNGMYSRPPRIVGHKYTGSDGLVKVFLAEACFLASRNILEKCSYYFEPTKSELRFLINNGEGLWLACSAARIGMPMYLDEGCIVFHCNGKDSYDQFRGVKNVKEKVRRK